MRRKMFSMILTAAMISTSLVSTLRADDEDAPAKSDEKAVAKKVDPIKRLVEIRIDPFLVRARAINIPLPGRVRTAQELMARFKKLSKDDSVGAILLNLDGVGLALPDIEELRAAILAFKESGKPVKAFLNSGDPNSYLLACAADEIAIAPPGSLIIPGLGRVFPFMRGMYQMQGIE